MERTLSTLAERLLSIPPDRDRSVDGARKNAPAPLTKGKAAGRPPSGKGKGGRKTSHL